MDFIKKLCIGYSLCLILLFILSITIPMLLDVDTISFSNSSCDFLDPAPFSSVECDNTLRGNILEFIFNFPATLIVITFFGFFSIKGAGLLLLFWGPFFLFAIIKTYEKFFSSSGQ